MILKLLVFPYANMLQEFNRKAIFCSILANYHMPCCQQWRKRALTYLLDEKTLYKLAGANLIFNSSSMKWKTSFQKLMDKGDRAKVNKIVVSSSILCMLVSLYHSNYYYFPIIRANFLLYYHGYYF